MSGSGRRLPDASRYHPAVWAGVLAAALVAALAMALASPARAQEFEPAPPPAIEIVSVEHAVSGQVEAAVNTASAELDLKGATAVLDGVPVEVRSLAVQRREPASIVIAIDTSGSMAGAPIVAAKEAARLLVDRLDGADRVAVVAFASQPVVAADFTANRIATRATRGALAAGGDMALYDAVTRALALLETASSPAPRVLVLLSDGRDAAGAADPRRELNVAAVQASGAAVHAFGLGTDVDEEYLRALARANGGSYSGVATEQALAPLFEALGTRLGASHRVVVDVPPLALGEHTLALRARSGVGASAFVFSVDNAGLVVLAEEPRTEADRIVVGISSPVEAARLNLSARLDGEPVPIVDGRVLLDPWTYAPGAHTMEVESHAGGGLAARAEVTVQVPTLAPELATRIDSSSEPATLIVEARAQGPGAHVIVVSAAGQELARVEGRELRVPLDAGPQLAAELSVALRAAGGDAALLASAAVAVPEALRLPPPVSTGTELPLWLLPALAVPLLVVLLVLLWVRRRAQRPPDPLAPRIQRLVRGGGGPLDRPELRGALVVRAADGGEQSYPLAWKPITIGSASGCDIALPSPGIRPVHARITPRGNDEFQVHGLSGGSARPYEQSGIDEWAVLRSGESIAVGDYVITLVLGSASDEEGAASDAPAPAPDASGEAA